MFVLSNAAFPFFQGEVSGDLPAISSLLWRERIEHAFIFTIFELIENWMGHVQNRWVLSPPSVWVNKLSSGYGKNVAIQRRSIVTGPLPASISVNDH